MDLKLSEFIGRNGKHIFVVKNSRGLMKRVKLGANVVEANLLSIVLDPYDNCELFRMSMSKAGGIVLKQSSEGDIKLKITRHITLEGLETEPDCSYVSAKFRQMNVSGVWSTKEVFVPIV